MEAHLPIQASACEGADSWVVTGHGDGYARYAVDLATGALSVVSTRGPLGVTRGDVLRVSGRWFAIGVGMNRPAAVEFSWGSTERPIMLQLPPTPPYVGAYSSNMESEGLTLPRGLYETRVLDKTIVSLFGIGNSDSSMSVGTKSAAAISYRIGCL
jgi:hypothetical protein